MKKCTICKLEKNFSQFFKHKHTKDGFGSLCNDCLKIRSEQKRREKGILPRRKGLDPHKIKLTKQKFFERRKHKTFPEISEKLCRKCNNILPIENFTKQLVNKDGFRNECRNCRYKSGKISSKLWRLDNWAKVLLASAKKHSTQVEIDEKFILELFEKQNKKCYWFDVPLMPSEVEKYPFQPSLDRLNRKLGYTKENVVLTCYTANIGRNISSTELFQEFCDILLKRKQS
jgi:isochorismate synthase EntC